MEVHLYTGVWVEIAIMNGFADSKMFIPIRGVWVVINSGVYLCNDISSSPYGDVN